MLFAIEVHGPDAIFEHLHWFRWFYRNDQDAFRRVKVALEHAGMDRIDVLDLVSGHDIDCACWRCVLRLYVDVLKESVRYEPPETAEPESVADDQVRA